MNENYRTIWILEPPFPDAPTKELLNRAYHRSGFGTGIDTKFIEEWYGAVLSSSEHDCIWRAYVGIHSRNKCKVLNVKLLTIRLWLGLAVYGFELGRDPAYDKRYAQLNRLTGTRIAPVGVLVRKGMRNLKRNEIGCGNIDSLLGTDGSRFFAIDPFMWSAFVSDSLLDLLSGQFSQELFMEQTE